MLLPYERRVSWSCLIRAHLILVLRLATRCRRREDTRDRRVFLRSTLTNGSVRETRLFKAKETRVFQGSSVTETSFFVIFSFHIEIFLLKFSERTLSGSIRAHKSSHLVSISPSSVDRYTLRLTDGLWPTAATATVPTSRRLCHRLAAC